MSEYTNNKQLQKKCFEVENHLDALFKIAQSVIVLSGNPDKTPTTLKIILQSIDNYLQDNFTELNLERLEHYRQLIAGYSEILESTSMTHKVARKINAAA